MRRANLANKCVYSYVGPIINTIIGAGIKLGSILITNWLEQKRQDQLMLAARDQAMVDAMLKNQLEQAKELPSNTWQAYLERGVKEVQEALGKVHSSASLESADETPPVETFKKMAEGFSKGLRAWEAMRAAVR